MIKKIKQGDETVGAIAPMSVIMIAVLCFFVGVLAGITFMNHTPRVMGEKKEILRIANYVPGDTLYFKYGYDNVMFIISKVDVKNKIFLGKIYNVFIFNSASDYILPFDEYLERKFN